MKVLKKISTVLLVLMMTTVLFAGCGKEETNNDSDSSNDATTKTDDATSDTKTTDDEIVIGYSLSVMSHEWYQNIVKGTEIRAEELGLKMVFADANMDSGKQISDIENLLAQNIDVLVITPVDAKALAPSIQLAHDKGIIVITESNVVEGADSFVGISNFESAKLTGLWYGEYAKENGVEPEVLLVGFENLEDCRQRVAGFKAGLDEIGIEYKVAQEINAEGSKEKALAKATDAFTANPNVNVIFGINDNSATGGMAAYTGLGMDEEALTVIGFGFEGVVGQSALLGDTPYKASLAMFPNYLGVGLVDVCLKAANGESIPEHYVTPTVVITQENFNEFYNETDDGYEMDFEAIRKIDVNM